MHIGQVAIAFSELFSLPLSKVQSTCRFLREAGHIRSGARGVNAHHAVDLEVVRVLLALMTSESPSDSVVRCKYFASLPVDPAMSGMSPAQFEKFKGHTAETVLAAFLKGVRDGEVQREFVSIAPESLKIRDFHKMGGSSLEINISMGTIDFYEQPHGQRVHFNLDQPSDSIKIEDYELPPFWSAMNRITRIDHTPLIHVAKFGRDGSETSGQGNDENETQRKH